MLMPSILQKKAEPTARLQSGLRREDVLYILMVFSVKDIKVQVMLSLMFMKKPLSLQEDCRCGHPPVWLMGGKLQNRPYFDISCV